MPPPRSTSCARCGHPKSDAGAFYRKGVYADGSPKLFPICKACAAADAAQPSKRREQNERRKLNRRKAGIPERRRGAAEFCPNGHRKAENLRPGRYDCAACHRDAQRDRDRAAGAKPRAPLGAAWSCSHDQATSVRIVNGKPKGCKHCHREAQRNRPFNYERWRKYYEANRQALNQYARAWRAINRPAPGPWKKIGPAKEYVALIKGDPCGYCGSASEAVDHIVAVMSGGSGCPQNLAPICKSCNSSKQTKDVLTFMLYRLNKAVLTS